MSALDTLLSTPLAYHLGWTLVHFLWQGTLVGALYACMRFVLRDSEPQSRYWLSLGTLAAPGRAAGLHLHPSAGNPLALPDIAGVAHSARSLRIDARSLALRAAARIPASHRALDGARLVRRRSPHGAEIATPAGARHAA